MASSPTEHYQSAARVYSNAEWDRKFGEIMVDNKKVTPEELVLVKKARSISVSGLHGDIRMQDGLEVDTLAFYNCGGDIVLGDKTVARTGVSFDECWGITSIAANLTCGVWLMAIKCDSLISIGPNLVLNPQGIEGEGVTAFSVSACSQFEMLYGPATINAAISIRQCPQFKGLPPDVMHDESFGGLTDQHRHPRNRKDMEAALREMRDLWEKNAAAGYVSPSPA